MVIQIAAKRYENEDGSRVKRPSFIAIKICCNVFERYYEDGEDNFAIVESVDKDNEPALVVNCRDAPDYEGVCDRTNYQMTYCLFCGEKVVFEEVESVVYVKKCQTVTIPATVRPARTTTKCEFVVKEEKENE